MELFLSFMQRLGDFLAGPFAMYAAEAGLGFCFLSVIFFGRHVIDHLFWVAVGSIGLLGLHVVVMAFV